MARTFTAIKAEMTTAYMSKEAVQQKYNLDPNKTFDEQFSALSIENIFFVVVTAALWTIERLFDVHKVEVNEELAIKMPHTTSWYAEKVRRFQYPNRDIVPDKDYYDNTGLTDDQIEALEVVKFCAVTDKLSILQIKVAKGEPGAREVLSADEVEGLLYYLQEIRDAGVNIEIVNRQADKFYGTIDVYYNPLLLTPADTPVETAIKQYISNLDFNAALTSTLLVDEIQKIEGVMLVNMTDARVQRADNDPEYLGVQKIAESGYWIVQNDADLTINYIPYSNGDI